MGKVIDACVLRSAGESGKPVPSACREALQEVLRNSLVVVVDEDLLAEWRRHKSRYASAWMTAMFARRRIVKVAAFSGRAASIDSAIGGLGEPDHSIAAKDSHLVKLAADHDKCVLSSERKCRAAFHKAASVCAELAGTAWIFPDYGDQGLRVLTGSEAPPAAWFLRNASPL